MTMPPRIPALLAALGLLVGACTATQEPSFYLLEPPGTTDRVPTGPVIGPVIGLREFALPLYARRQQIAVLGADGAVAVSDLHRWVEDPSRAITRVVARSLSAGLDRPVVVEPWPPGVAPEQRVDVEVDLLLGALDGDLRLEGQYRVIRAAGPAGGRVTPFALVEPVGGPRYNDLVLAHGRILQRLAAAIEADIRR
ncbi:MAG: PqiC family protein [Pseudomonadota bacterium]